MRYLLFLLVLTLAAPSAAATDPGDTMAQQDLKLTASGAYTGDGTASNNQRVQDNFDEVYAVDGPLADAVTAAEAAQTAAETAQGLAKTAQTDAETAQGLAEAAAAAALLGAVTHFDFDHTDLTAVALTQTLTFKLSADYPAVARFGAVIVETGADVSGPLASLAADVGVAGGAQIVSAADLTTGGAPQQIGAVIVDGTGFVPVDANGDISVTVTAVGQNLVDVVTGNWRVTVERILLPPPAALA